MQIACWFVEIFSLLEPDATITGKRQEFVKIRDAFSTCQGIMGIVCFFSLFFFFFLFCIESWIFRDFTVATAKVNQVLRFKLFNPTFFHYSNNCFSYLFSFLNFIDGSKKCSILRSHPDARVFVTRLSYPNV